MKRRVRYLIFRSERDRFDLEIRNGKLRAKGIVVYSFRGCDPGTFLEFPNIVVGEFLVSGAAIRMNDKVNVSE